jgi:hypothetical protein
MIYVMQNMFCIMLVKLTILGYAWDLYTKPEGVSPKIIPFKTFFEWNLMV